MTTSWESVSKWYDGLVGHKGHYFHEHLILPKLLENPVVKSAKSFLDVACGQGVLARGLGKEAEYCGIDLSDALIAMANSHGKAENRTYLVGNAATFDLTKKDFDVAFIILALQNIEDEAQVLKNCFNHLKSGGRLLLVLNHPCFRIPRQSSWQEDEKSSILYRRLNLYLSELKVPIKTNPGKGEDEVIAFHRPMGGYFKLLKEAGFMVEDLEEWVSDKKSEGRCSKMENRARSEFPLFLFIQAIKA